MNAPLFSTFTLFTELLVTAAVFYIFYKGYHANIFASRLAALTLGYESLFNITYMTYRAFAHESGTPHTHTQFHIAVAAFHGIFSLSMFIALIIFITIAWREYRKGNNFFRKHSIMSLIFLVLWTIAIISGVLFYYLAYFTNT